MEPIAATSMRLRRLECSNKQDASRQRQRLAAGRVSSTHRLMDASSTQKSLGDFRPRAGCAAFRKGSVAKFVSR
jgi:hypothetical protein